MDVAVSQAWADLKVGQKSVSFLKRSVLTVQLLQFVQPADPMELALIFYLKITFDT